MYEPSSSFFVSVALSCNTVGEDVATDGEYFGSGHVAGDPRGGPRGRGSRARESLCPGAMSGLGPGAAWPLIGRGAVCASG